MKWASSAGMDFCSGMGSGYGDKETLVPWWGPSEDAQAQKGRGSRLAPTSSFRISSTQTLEGKSLTQMPTKAEGTSCF